MSVTTKSIMANTETTKSADLGKLVKQFLHNQISRKEFLEKREQIEKENDQSKYYFNCTLCYMFDRFRAVLLYYVQKTKYCRALACMHIYAAFCPCNTYNPCAK